MTMYVSGWDDNDQPIWEDDGETSGGGMDTSILPTYSVQDPMVYRTTDPGVSEDAGGGANWSQLGTIAERAVSTQALGEDLIYTLPDGSRVGQNPETGQYYSLTDAQYNAMNAAINTPAGGSAVSRDTLASLRGQPVAPTGASSVDKIIGGLKGYFTDAKGNTDWAKLATAAAGIKAVTGVDKVQTSGWQGKIPMDLQAIRGRIDYNDPNRKPGSAGRQYFTDMAYASPSNVDAAKAGVTQQAQGILSNYTPTPALPPQAPPQQMQSLPASGVSSLLPVPKATGLASGGIAQPRYLQGMTDGMEDKIPSSIDGKQKAALSHGEFVIPADVVSHFGNGNSDAGAKKLYDMMARIRKARTGTTQQGKRINPDSFMPGGQVGYAAGGIARFAGPDGSAVTGSTGTTGTSAASTAIPSLGTSASGELSNWAGPYVADYLGKGAALSNAPYQAYTGQLTAGPSALQQQQFQGLSGLANNQTFDANAAQQYMNPYLQASLNPQLDELRRQAQITNLGNQAQATKQGGFGGSGSVLMQTEGQRNMLDKMSGLIGSGYNTAYNNAATQFGADKSRQLQAQTALGNAGETQRAIEQQGLTADKTQFEEQRDDPYKKVQYQKDLLQGLPVTTTATTNNTTQLSQIASQLSGLQALYSTLSGLGQAPAK